MRKIKIIFTIGLALYLLPFRVSAQQPVGEPLDRKITLVISGLDQELLLKILSSRARVQIGFEPIVEAQGVKTKKVDVSVRKGTVRDALDSFTASDPRYVWEMAGEIINVKPKEPQPGILDVVIPQFYIAGANLADLSLGITQVPEVQARLESLGLKRVSGFVSVGQPQPTTLHTVSLSEMTIREILNDLLNKGYATYWCVSRVGEGQRYVMVELYHCCAPG